MKKGTVYDFLLTAWKNERNFVLRDDNEWYILFVVMEKGL
jgi:hypothetical protein